MIEKWLREEKKKKRGSEREKKEEGENAINVAAHIAHEIDCRDYSNMLE